MDLTYDGSRALVLTRGGAGAEPAFRFSWRDIGERSVVYAQYRAERFPGTLEKTDLFVVPEHEGVACGLLMIVVPAWTDAGEITDLAVDARHRRLGAGRALVDAAVAFAREHGLRALWVEPRSDNAAAIEFYVSLGFRFSGFNDRMYSNADDDPGRTTLFMHLEL